MSERARCERCGSERVDSVCARCASRSIADESTDRSLLVAGRYALREELGEGGMGRVQRARDHALDRDVAIKFLPASAARDREARQRLEREAKALAKLDHPNIVRVLDLAEDEGELFMVMELVEGRTLAAVEAPSLSEVVVWTRALASALALAHERGVLHRDIKPENVLLDADGVVKLTDFGIARSVGAPASAAASLPRITDDRWVSGTPGFMAPEAMAGAAPTPAQDMYALGALASLLLRDAPAADRHGHLRASMETLVSSMLSPTPERRPASMRTLEQSLRSLERAGEGELPSDERFFVWGAALLSTVSAALGCLAALLSLSPRVMREEDLVPLTHLVNERLADGRVVSRARFETEPILFFVFVTALAFAVLGLLKRHWRHAGLETHEPERPVAETRALAVMAVLSNGVYAVHRVFLAEAPFARFIPLVGGLFELVALFFFMCGLLSAWRTARPLGREPALFATMALVALPPFIELARYLDAWTPS